MRISLHAKKESYLSRCILVGILLVSGGMLQAEPSSPAVTTPNQVAQGGVNKIQWDQFALKTIGGKKYDSKLINGKAVLVVNTASKCGYTPQFKELQQLFQKYQSKGLMVFGFPSDDFNQDPGTETEIAKFCEVNYGVKFPLMSKGKVKGEDAQPIFKALSQMAPDKGAVQWNFEKFLVNKEGQVIGRFRSSEGIGAIEPMVLQALK